MSKGKKSIFKNDIYINEQKRFSRSQKLVRIAQEGK
jgi:hypothetical protein